MKISGLLFSLDILRLVLQQSIDWPENMKADSCIIKKVASVLAASAKILTYEREK